MKNKNEDKKRNLKMKIENWKRILKIKIKMNINNEDWIETLK